MAMQKLAVKPSIKLVKQAKRKFSHNVRFLIAAEIKIKEAKFIQEVQYLEWLANRRMANYAFG